MGIRISIFLLRVVCTLNFIRGPVQMQFLVRKQTATQNVYVYRLDWVVIVEVDLGAGTLFDESPN